ncbi:hypothetical protein PR003_g7742 [Phytophthora rubi]|uniref:FZ domain-containing protein n=1 Tax=Phytophthora rubi TaxID=129364 RepID=A0A6A3MN83_9STRA|nr:hypothetical protein PR002_g9146 [Phytophthora rubi]KAE9035802.1 hypothetical protein PR001_g9140 [Phytophthora rubi]KAE9345825.1 hypothetical protein PR003_g7742 [Phytophthora rubi]
MTRSPFARCVLASVLVAAVHLSWVDVSVALTDGEEPANPVCRYIAKDSLSFCSMVDYMAVVDADDPTGARFDSKAEFYYRNVDVVLQRFGCHAKYSVYGCDDCREAYKYWVCSIKFQKCGSQTVTTDRGATKLQYCTDTCDYNTATSTSSTTGKTTTSSCVEGSSGRYRTCLSICEDVVRKCPYVLNFQCPTTETPFFSADITTCNKLDRVSNPDRPSRAWPGTFADA